VDEEERLREISFLEYEIKEIEEADLKEGEDEALEADYRRFSNGKKIMEAVNAAYQYTGNQDDNVSELTGRALRELNAAASYDEKVKALEEQLLEIDNLVNDFSHADSVTYNLLLLSPKVYVLNLLPAYADDSSLQRCHPRFALHTLSYHPRQCSRRSHADAWHLMPLQLPLPFRKRF
jgi:hypothetical protein